MKICSVESFHTLLFCSKWDDCIAFYRDILGFAVVDEKPGFIEFEVRPGSRIGLLQSVRDGASKKRAAPHILSFRIENLEEVHKDLSSRCPTASALRKHPWGALLFEIRDPEERRLEFWMPVRNTD
jgi:catechol 2,3-dioxygenase-like lactoylglutathione lyase family enzyme